MYSSASLLLVGNNTLVQDLRISTTLELFLYPDFYINKMKTLKRRLRGLCMKDEEEEKKEKEAVTPIPKKLSAIMFFLMLCDGMKLTMTFSYLPKLVEWFGVRNVDVGYWAGILASSVYIGRFLFSYVWGNVSDMYGKKLTIIVSATALVITSLLFGFSDNYWYALVTRFLQGCATGLVPISKSVLKEHCDDTNITVMMAIAVTAFVVGLALGPGFAGVLAFPADLYPTVFSKDGVFAKYPALLPNLMIVGCLTITIVFTIIYLPKDKPKNYTLVQQEDNPPVNISLKDKIKNMKFIQVLRQKWCLVTCILYTLLAIVNTALTEMFPIFAATKEKYGGLSFEPYDIGVVFIISSIALLVIQFAVIIRFTNKYGCKSVFIWCCVACGIIFPFLPFSAAIENTVLQWIAITLYILIIQIFMTGGFLAVYIMINNSVDDLNYLGAVNGLGTSLSSLGRAVSPVIFGSTYAWSLTNVEGVEGNNTALGFPFNQYFVFILLSLVSLITAFITVFVPVSLNKSHPNTQPIPMHE